MADKTKIAGVAEKTVVVQLAAVSYQISVHYLGPDRIKHTKAAYRCRHQLYKEAAVAPPAVGVERADPALTPVASPAAIPNLVHASADDDAAARPALPAKKRGDSSNPDPDEVYRIVFTDNHGTHKADNLPLLRGEKTKHDTYQARGWLPDITPAVPFRVVVRKFCGDTQVPMVEKVELVVEIKDPVEEFDQNSGNRQTFLRGFFKKYNRTDSDPDPGDDNAPQKFAGVRTASAAFAGVKAADVLKQVACTKPPQVVEAAGNPDAVEFTALSAATAEDTALAVFPVTTTTEVAEPKLEVGVADFVFLPPPVSGDNYRFLFTIRGALEPGGSAKKDPREQKVNGAPIRFLDDAKKEIKGSCAYTTGRFVIWRRTQIRLLVTCNGATAAGIDFASMQATYRKSFLMLEGPVHTFDADWKVWRDALKTCYAAGADAWFADANEANLRLAYADGLIPGDLESPGVNTNFKFRHGGTTTYTYRRTNVRDDIEEMARLLIKSGCTIPATKLSNPDGHDQIDFDHPDSDGLFVMFARRSALIGSLLGAYFGDRMFHMFETTLDDTTYTCSHELGHALGLSHSLTKSLSFPWTSAASPNVAFMEATSNCRFHDHDQNDAASCVMSYIAGDHLLMYPYHPCGACALALRYYKKAEFQKKEHFGKGLLEQLEPAVIAVLSSTGDFLTAAIPDLAVGADAYFVALGKEVDWPVTGGATFKARVGLSGLAGFTAKGVGATKGAVTVDAANLQLSNTLVVHKVTGVTAGRVELEFSHYGVTASAQFNVV